MRLWHLIKTEVRIYGPHLIITMALALLLYSLVHHDFLGILYDAVDSAIAQYLHPAQPLVISNLPLFPVGGGLVQSLPALLGSLAAAYLVTVERESGLLEMIASRSRGLTYSVGLRLLLAVAFLLTFALVWTYGITLLPSEFDPLLDRWGVMFVLSLGPMLFLTGLTLLIATRAGGTGAAMAGGIGLWLALNIPARIPGSPFKDPELRRLLPFPLMHGAEAQPFLWKSTMAYAAAGIALLLLEYLRIRGGYIRLDAE